MPDNKDATHERKIYAIISGGEGEEDIVIDCPACYALQVDWRKPLHYSEHTCNYPGKLPPTSEVYTYCPKCRALQDDLEEEYKECHWCTGLKDRLGYPRFNPFF